MLVIKRNVPAANSNSLPTQLDAPVFSPATETIAFGDTVRITASDRSLGGVIEYSRDSGTSWTSGNQLIVYDKVTIVARVRAGQQTSLLTTQNFTPYFQRMLVIGNSIMLHGPAPSIGWYNNNGMAASSPEKDFVHLLTGYLLQRNPQLSIQLQYANNFETNFGKESYSLDEFIPILQTFKPDLIILRLGENVDDGQVVGRHFEEQYRQLVDRLANFGQPVKLVATTSVWNRPQADAAIRKVINEKAYSLVDLGYMVGQPHYFAHGQYAVPGVADHPGDTGMQEIANQIWAKIK